MQLDIHLDISPESWGWIMYDNKPVQLKVQRIVIDLDCATAIYNISEHITYHLTGSVVATRKANEVFRSKQELMKKVFEL